MPHLLLATHPPFAAFGLEWLESTLEGAQSLWPLWLPLLAGAAAVFLLLPRPRAFPLLWGLLATGLALVLAGGLLVPADDATIEAVLFYAFAAIAVVSGGLLVTQRNPARAALSFALVVLSTCGLFLLLAAPFLMAATVIIYAGAIVVTFLFVLMLAQQEGLSDADVRSREPLLATLTGFVLLGALLYVLQVSFPKTDPRLKVLLKETRAAASKDSVAEIETVLAPAPRAPGELPPTLYKRYREVFRARGQTDLEREVEQLETAHTLRDGTIESLRDTLRKLEAVGVQAERRSELLAPPPRAALSPLSGPPANVPPNDQRRDATTGLLDLPAENSAYLGRSLFTDYLLPVELAGTLLLVATIGAIAIAHRRAAAERPS